MSELPLNSNLTFPKALKYISSSLSKSNVPEVSTEYAWTFEYGSDVKSFFEPVIPCTLTAITLLVVNTTKSRIVLYELIISSPDIRSGATCLLT